MHGEGPTQGCGGQDTRGAHFEHAVHVLHAGRVEAQRLVERLRVLPSRKEGVQCGARCRRGGGRACVGNGASGMHGEGPTKGWGPQGMRRAHLKHVAHVRDAGGLPV
eukprot:scaffold100520_cov42-Phaeocystis_antarctica.AAC.1